MISVAICTYNGEKYIIEQLESIYRQTVMPDEIVICDDCSDDRTVELAERSLKASGISYKINVNPVRMKVWKNFSQCIHMCSGTIIFSCDQDDVWKENKIEVFLKCFKDEKCVLAYSDADIIDSEGRKIADSLWEIHGLSGKPDIQKYKLNILRSMFMAGCNMAFTKKFYDDISPVPQYFIHDGWLAVCAPLFGNIMFINDKLMHYRRHGLNASELYIIDKNKQSVKRSCRGCILEMRNTPWAVWFNCPSHFYRANKVFLERMGKKMSDEYCGFVTDSIMYFNNIRLASSKGAVSRLMMLFIELINKRYGKFRGGKELLLKDFLYLLIHDKEPVDDGFIW